MEKTLNVATLGIKFDDLETNRATAEGVLAAMQDIQHRGPECQATGICYNVGHHWLLRDASGVRHEDIYYILRTLFRTWPGFSGDDDYPVPGGDHAYDALTLWPECHTLYMTQYQRQRVLLLDHCIAVLDDILGEA